MNKNSKRVIDIIVLILLVISCIASVIVPVMAKERQYDEYVVLGGDLNKKQEKQILSLMGVDKNTSITKIEHKREVKELKKYLGMKHIGKVAVSSAYVKKVDKGLKLKTININYVTNRIYKNIMTTIGMKNVEVTIAAPKPTLGSCAVLGLMDGYEKITNTKISKGRKKLALEEMKMTIELHNKFKSKGDKFWDRLKTKVINCNIKEFNECKAMTKTIASISDINLSKADINKIANIMIKMAKYLSKENIKQKVESKDITNKDFGIVLDTMINEFSKNVKSKIQ